MIAPAARWLHRTLAALALLTLGPATHAQVVHDHGEDEHQALELPEASADLIAHVEAPFWSDDERATLRVEHGLWDEADLNSPARIARAMLLAGRVNHPTLGLPLADPLDRAEAMVRRGEMQGALALLEGADAVRAHRLRAEALELMGRYDEADGAVNPVVEELLAARLDDADALVDGVLALRVRSRVRGPSRLDDPGSAAADFRAMNALLARARDELDRQSWRARAVEAELLRDKGNARQAFEAAMEALSRNPRSARAMRVIGEIAVDQFDFDRALAIAATIESLADGGADQPVPAAALIRCRAALRQNDIDGAEAHIDAVLSAMPSHPEALAMRAAVVASRFDDAQTAAAIQELDDWAGGAPHHAVLQAGIRLGEARQYESAAALLSAAIQRQPNLATSWAELGLLQLQAANDQEALDALREAARLDPFDTRAVNSLALVEQLVEWPTLESEHFVVRYREGIDELLAREMLPMLEAMHNRVCGPDGFDHEPSRKTLIELMPDHATFAVRITGMPALHTVAAATGPAIAMESPQEGPGFSTGVYDWPRVLEHEYAHTVTLSRTRNRIPHWFTEAASVWMEDKPRPWSWWRLLARAHAQDRLFAMDEISLRFVRPIEPGDRTQAYAQGHWMYEYLAEAHGREAPLALMDLYAEGVDQDRAMRRVIGVGEEAFFEAFKGWAAAELRAAGLLLGEGTPTLAELAAQAGVDPQSDPSGWPEGTIGGWLREHPDHPEVLALAARTRLDSRGDKPLSLVPDLVPLLRRLAEVRPVDPMPHRELARLALRGELDGAEGAGAIAIEHLEFLDVRETSTPAFARALAERYALEGDMVRAWSKAQRAVHVAPFDPSLRELAATVAVQTGQWSQAERMLSALAALEPDRPIHTRRLEAVRKMRGEL